MIKICNILIGIYSLLKTYDVHMLYDNLIYYFLWHISSNYAFYLTHKILDVYKNALVKAKCPIEMSNPLYLKKTSISTFIKTKFKVSDDQTNIDKYRLSANITEYHILSKLILQRIIFPKFMMIFQLKENNLVEIGPQIRKLGLD